MVIEEYKFDLQFFTDPEPAAQEAVQGKKIAYLYRKLSEASTAAGAKVAFTTENETSYSADAATTQTKDGVIRTPGNAEVEISATSLLMKGDTMLGKLRDALVNGDLFEIWEVNLAEPGTDTNKFKGRYFQGYVTEFTKSSNAEDIVECSLTFGINGAGVDGDVTVTAAQQAMIELYGFADSTQVSSGSGGQT